MTIVRSIVRPVVGPVAYSPVSGVRSGGTGPPTYSSVVGDSVMHFLLDENAANTDVVSQVGGFTGILQGGDTTADLHIADPLSGFTGAINFDGANDYVGAVGSVGSASFIQNTGTFTIAFRAKFANTTSRYAVMGNLSSPTSKGFILERVNLAGYGSNTLRIGLARANAAWGLDVSAPDNFCVDTNVHSFVVRGQTGIIDFFRDNSTSVAQVVNGSQQGTFSASTGDSSQVLQIGAWTGLTVLEMGGWLFDVVISDQSWSIADIAAWMEGPN